LEVDARAVDLTVSHTLERLFSLETFGIKLGLENITRLCAALGNPERDFRSLHIAGTNGKGSIAALTHAALVASGIRAARYTSPHLTDLTERFVIDREPVSEPALEAVTADLFDCVDRLLADGTLTVLPTFFEMTTAVAFELFRRAGVEVAVIEVGLGGRFDATNVIAPVATAITTIGFDHQQHLGSTLRLIAFEKAGIIKPRVPVITGTLPAEAIEEVRTVAAARDAPLIEAAEGVRVQTTMRDGRAELAVTTPVAEYGPLLLALRGEHQIGNAVVAIRLLEAARTAGVAVTQPGIERGLAEVDWPARLELFVLAHGKRVLLDAAHNEDGANALARYLQRWHPERPALVVGIMRDKAASDILAHLLPSTSRVFATAAPTPRALPAPQLAEKISAVTTDREVEVIADPEAAIERALQVADSVCVAGSVFLAGAVRPSLKRRAILQ
jgi:dihydrofolate synthase/folylpolyglutamate synthase